MIECGEWKAGARMQEGWDYGEGDRNPGVLRDPKDRGGWMGWGGGGGGGGGGHGPEFGGDRIRD